jgi:hypothetical protein
MQDICCFACACCAHALQHFGPGAKADWWAPWQDNFYTLTVYEKGAEVVRLYHTLLGVEGFRRAHDDMKVAMPMCFMPCLSQAHPLHVCLARCLSARSGRHAWSLKLRCVVHSFCSVC